MKVINILSRSKLSKYRITLDEKKDFQLIKKIYKQFFNKSYYFDHTKIVKFLKSNTKVYKINSMIKRNEGYVVSLKND